eukprot:Anaeramoba_ignava/a89818_9.p1 GENE.a89818_9~~a89818_9.p1  ORF type:complete len:190 (-),score=-18.02 a89818_9:143-712(-)
MMNILLLDTEETKEQLELLINIFKMDWVVFSPRHIKEAGAVYSSNKIDFLIVNFIIEENKIFLDQVIKENPKQKTITIGDVLACSNQYGCKSCIENLNRKRIIQPIDMRELYDTINNFDNSKCRYYLNFDNVIALLPKIIKRYNFCTYDSENRIIQCNDSHLYYLFELSELLAKNNIGYELVENQIVIK